MNKHHPLTAERCPEGMKGKCFYQKDFTEALPPGVRTRVIPAFHSASLGGSEPKSHTLILQPFDH